MGKQLFDLNQPGWHAYGLPDPVLDDLKARAKFDSDTLVKINPVRAVFACEDCFVKFEVPDTRFKRWVAILRPKAKLEYRSALALQRAGIPVVEYLGWLRRGAVNVAVSRRWAGGDATAYDYLYRQLVYGDGDGAHFRARLIDFLNGFNRAGFRHPDLHLGNLLYSATQEQLVLVDVYGVKPIGRLTRRDLLAHAHLLTELRAALAATAVIDDLARLDVFESRAAAEAYYWNNLEQEALLRLAEWPKRQKQIMRGYPKLLKIDGERFLRKDELRQILFDEAARPEKMTASEEDAFALFQASIYWQLCGIPHRRVVAFELPNVIYLENLNHCKSAPEENARIADFRRELKIFGFGAVGALVTDRHGRPMIYDPKAALDDFRHKMMFY